MKDRPEFWRDCGSDAGRDVRTYCGLRQPDGTTVVSVDGHPLDLRGDFRKQSATAFDWGYAGSGGPAQLALAILADHWANDETARRHYERFVRRVIRNLPTERWSMTGEQIDSSLGRDEPAAQATSDTSSHQS
jgi:Family of unknown function (DUF6166)